MKWRTGILLALAMAATAALPDAQQRDVQSTTSATGTARIYGRVVAADTGTPVRRAVVTLTRTAAPVAGRSGTTTLPNGGRWIATTDDEGAFDFRGLPAGSFSFRITKSGFVDSSFPLSPVASDAVLNDAQAVDRGDLRLPRGGVISGRIIDEYGEPVAGATVSALRVTYLGPGSRRLAAVKTGETSDLGDYRLFGLAPGTYYVAAGFRQTQISVGDAGGLPTQFVGAGRGLAPTFYPGTTVAADAQEVTVTPGEETPGVGIRLLAVPLARVEGSVVDSQGRPAQKVVVMLNPARPGGVVGIEVNAAEIGADGRFSLTNVAPGDYQIDVYATESLEAIGRTGSVMRTSAEFASQPVTVGGDVSDLVIRMTPGFEVSGRVLLDGAAAPVAVTSSLEISLLPALQSEGLGGFFGTSGPVQRDGTFAIPGSIGIRLVRVRGLPAGAAVARILARGMDATDDGFTVDQPVAGVEIEITTRPARVTGVVTDAAGTAVRNSAVIVFSEDSRLWTKWLSRWVATAISANDGGFTVTGLPPGNYRAIAVEQLEQGQWANPVNLQRLAAFATPFTLATGEAKTLTLVRR